MAAGKLITLKGRSQQQKTAQEFDHPGSWGRVSAGASSALISRTRHTDWLRPVRGSMARFWPRSSKFGRAQYSLRHRDSKQRQN